MALPYSLNLKISWSLFWRSILLSQAALILGGIVIISAILLLSYLSISESVMTPSIIIIGIIVSLAVLIGSFYVHKWMINRLSYLPYKEGKITLMNEQNSVEKFSLFDSLCFLWSQTWRHLIIMSAIFLLICALLLLLSRSLSFITSDVLYFQNLLLKGDWGLNLLLTIVSWISYPFSIHWVLSRKHEGRWLKITLHTPLESTPLSQQSAAL